jgi:hypothetical protein
VETVERGGDFVQGASSKTFGQKNAAQGGIFCEVI